MGADEGTKAGDRLDVLVTLAEDYGPRRWPIEPLDPVRVMVPLPRRGRTITQADAALEAVREG